MITLKQARLICAISICLALASCSHFMSQPTPQERQALCDKLDTLKKEDYAKVEMHPVQESELFHALNKSVKKVLDQYDPPKRDGKKYFGEIKIELDAQGFIVKTIVSIPSGSSALDQAMLNAANSTNQLELSEDRCVARFITSLPMILNYTEEDMK